MKNQITYIVLIVFIAISCKKEQDPKPSAPCIGEEIPFVGHWSRQFYAGVDALHTASYRIYQDSIRYQINGSIGLADYAIIRDTFLTKDNRYVGHTIENRFYVLLFKNINTDSLSLYKQRVFNLEEGLKLPIPNDSTTLNYGWNTYYKQAD